MASYDSLALTIPTVSKLIGCNQRHVKEGIENGTFPHGYMYYSQRNAAVCRISKVPFAALLGITDTEIEHPENETMRVKEAASLIGCSPDTVKGAIRNGTFKYGFYYITEKGTKVYRIARRPFMAMLLQTTVPAMGQK